MPFKTELTGSQLAELRNSKLFNEDLAPVPANQRKWRVGSFAALWISMSACIPTYMLASSLIGGGMNWWQAILTIFLGNLIVLVPMVLNAHAGTMYGIPFPVYCRAAFGTKGANVPALMRAFVACGWFGIQTWIGGNAIYKILGVFIPPLVSGTQATLLGITLPQFLCFLFFWGINMLVVYEGIDCIRWLLNIKAPLLIALGLLLLAWAYRRAGGFGPILSQPSAFDPNGYIFTWLIAYSALLGPVGGILIADYFVWRRHRLDLVALYQGDGQYRFTNGFSLVALLALVIGVLPSLPGFLVQVKLLDANKVAPFLVSLYHYAWFIGFALAFLAYLAGRKLTALAPPAVALNEPQAAIE